MFKVVERFYLFEYNNKTRGMKAKVYEVGDTVTYSVQRRLSQDGQQRYLSVV